jgi:hypothetical protein
MIGYAEQKGFTVYVYGPNGGYIWHRVGTLLGYTINTVTIKHGSTTYICGEHGKVKATR